MRAFFRVILFALAGFGPSESAFGLEKRTIQFDDSWPDEWNTRNTCRINYYNICTGWIWCWSGFQDGDRMGVVFESCGQISKRLRLHVRGGFTGTISTYPADANNCPVQSVSLHLHVQCSSRLWIYGHDFESSLFARSTHANNCPNHSYLYGMPDCSPGTPFLPQSDCIHPLSAPKPVHWGGTPVPAEEICDS